MGRLSVIVLDTNALLFLMINQHRLSKPAMEAIQETDELIVSSISIWVIAIKNKKGKLPLPFTPEELVYHLKSVSNLTIKAVDEQIWLKNVALDWENRDPADRTVVATASLMGIPIISSDKSVQEFYPKTIW